MTRIVAICVGAWTLVIVGVVLAVTSVPAKPHHNIRPLDQPRCFPPGTLSTERFSMCPDSLPEMRAT